MPNRLLGLVGQHEDFPVENLSRSHCKRFVASCSHDQKIKFWNIEGIENQNIDAQQKPKRTFKQPQGRAGNSDFFADLDDAAEASGSNEESDDSLDSDAENDVMKAAVSDAPGSSQSGDAPGRTEVDAVVASAHDHESDSSGSDSLSSDDEPT